MRAFIKEYMKLSFVTILLLTCFALQAESTTSCSLEQIEQALTNVADEANYKLLSECAQQIKDMPDKNAQYELSRLFVRRMLDLKKQRDSFFRNNWNVRLALSATAMGLGGYVLLRGNRPFVPFPRTVIACAVLSAINLTILKADADYKNIQGDLQIQRLDNLIAGYWETRLYCWRF